MLPTMNYIQYLMFNTQFMELKTVFPETIKFIGDDVLSFVINRRYYTKSYNLVECKEKISNGFQNIFYYNIYILNVLKYFIDCVIS